MISGTNKNIICYLRWWKVLRKIIEQDAVARWWGYGEAAEVLIDDQGGLHGDGDARVKSWKRGGSTPRGTWQKRTWHRKGTAGSKAKAKAFPQHFRGVQGAAGRPGWLGNTPPPPYFPLCVRRWAGGEGPRASGKGGPGPSRGALGAITRKRTCTRQYTSQSVSILTFSAEDCELWFSPQTQEPELPPSGRHVLKALGRSELICPLIPPMLA